MSQVNRRLLGAVEGPFTQLEILHEVRLESKVGMAADAIEVGASALIPELFFSFCLVYTLVLHPGGCRALR